MTCCRDRVRTELVETGEASVAALSEAQHRLDRKYQLQPDPERTCAVRHAADGSETATVGTGKRSQLRPDVMDSRNKVGSISVGGYLHLLAFVVR